MSQTEMIVPVPLSEGRAYDIHIGSGLLAKAGEIIAGVARSRRAVIITQPNIAALWAAPLRESLKQAGFGDVPMLTFTAGERYKNLRTVTRLLDGLYALEAPTVDRKTVVIALGGGVVGDVAGFVASLYLRGLDYVQIPTTLLAMVDSSVGGKTGVDFHAGKNLVGAFHQPRAVVIDPGVLKTLSAREHFAGMAEVVKYGVIRDPELFARVQSRAPFIAQQEAEDITYVVRRSCEIKAEVVVADEHELTGLRAILNYGHTIGHALEAATNYRRYKHGEAVAIGMMAAAAVGEIHGATPAELRGKLGKALRANGLPTELPADISQDELLELTGRDKKAEAGKARFVLARGLGDVALYDDVSDKAVREGLRAVTAGARGERHNLTAG